MYLVFALGRMPARICSRTAAIRYQGLIVRAWGRMALRIGGFKLSITGSPCRNGHFTVSNHFGSVDTVIVCAATGSVFIARHDVEFWPVIGFLARQLGTIFINRENRREVALVNKRISEAIMAEYSLHMFAEGRVGPGRVLLPFKPSLLEPVVQAKIPVHYMTIKYRAMPGEPSPADSVLWREGQSLKKHIVAVMRLKGGEVTAVFGDEPVLAGDRKQLAEELHARVKDEFEPLE